MRKSMTRHLTDFAQRGRGRQGQRFLFELRPSCVENIPGTLGDVVLSWQRGGKLQVTKVQPVDKAYSYVVFDDDTVLCMTTTIYKDNQHWLPKEYALKLQTVTRGKDGVDKTKTVAKYTLDFSCFCSLGASNESEAIEVNMKPFGKLYAQVKVQMLNSHAGPSDALSDMSFATGRQSVESREDQDLTGFGEEYPEMDTDNRENRTSAARTGAQAGSARKPPRANHRRTASNQLPGTIPEHADVASTSSSAAGDTSAGTNGATPTGRRATAEDVATDSSAEMGRTWKSWLGRSASTINGTASPTGAAGTPRGAAGVGEKVGSYDTVADIRRVKNASDLANVKGLALQFIEQRDSEQLRASRGAGGGSGGVDVMSDLIDAKVQLADSDFQIQELKRELHKEKARSRLLSSRLTSLQAKHELLRNANE